MKEILDYSLISFKSFDLTIGGIITAILILFATRVTIYLINVVFLKNYFKQRDIDYGRSYAIRQFIKYIFYFGAMMIIMKSFGMSLSMILLGSAGLLVGIGLGLQNTFNDLLSGLILLMEQDVAVGDIVVIDGTVGVVQKIGLRTSTVKTRDVVSIIIPNSKLVGQNITNWSHNDSAARFHIDFGVSYRSDIDIVENIVLDTVYLHTDVLSKPPASVQLLNYGESSLDFRLYFFSDEFFYIEKVKSDIRKDLFKAFRKNNVEIPFPQRDVWFKNNSPTTS